jgi:hypothetical protein
MKIYYLKSIAVMILSVVFVLVTGCEGPAGPQGLQGEQGDSGPQGPQGDRGTANVIYSDWINFDGQNWSDPFTFFGQTRRQYPIAETRIDTGILETGTVMVYVRFGGTFSQIQPLPIIQSVIKVTNQFLGFHLQLGTIMLIFYDLNSTDDPGVIGSGNSYRYVIIPGETPAKIIAKMPDLNDYYAVMNYFGIEP